MRELPLVHWALQRRVGRAVARRATRALGVESPDAEVGGRGGLVVEHQPLAQRGQRVLAEALSPHEASQRQLVKAAGCGGEGHAVGGARDAVAAQAGALHARGVVHEQQVVARRQEAHVGPRPLRRPLEDDGARDPQS